MSLFSEIFSTRRREAGPPTKVAAVGGKNISLPVPKGSAGGNKRISYPPAKSSADGNKRTPYPDAKPTADADKRRRRRSLTAKYQTFFSNISQDFRSLGPAPEPYGSINQKPQKPIESKPAPAVKPSVAETVTPVTIIEPQEPTKPAQEPEIPEKPRLRRRPKTPVRRIGDLEGHRDGLLGIESLPNLDKLLANLRDEPEVTRALNLTSTSPTPRSLRKVGAQQDLRRTSVDSDEVPKSPNLSDVDTVVGSESPGCSPRRSKHDSHQSFHSSGSWCSNSTTSRYSTTSENGAPSEKDFAVPGSWSSTSSSARHSTTSEFKDFAVPTASKEDLTPKKKLSVHDITTTPSDFAHNIEMQICLDLLKNDLSSALSPKNPSDSTLALQIWLMIESYESLKQRLQKQLLKKVGPGSQKTSEFTFQAMDHWLEALYSVYNTQLQERRQNLSRNHVTA